MLSEADDESLVKRPSISQVCSGSRLINGVLLPRPKLLTGIVLEDRQERIIDSSLGA
ncbi:hypothetical protein [Rhizobium sp. FKL33]|uniref:hypothetical protein n=1 Tax=Rhizobium sp. FKL33 TaxID=2562307 RepID=UPI001484F2B9|nr:hypothetical protein [Rhizobium sp. FKL33]